MTALKIAPSILSADFSRLKDEIQAVEAAGADWLHVDVMDGHFVPNITIGPVVVESIRKVTKIPLDVHLMITDPDKYAPEFIKAGADWVSIHPDTCQDPNLSLKRIRELGAKASIAVNPDVPLEKVTGRFSDIDMILMMTVFPGFGGQAFIPNVLPKIEQVRKVIDQKKLSILVEADGGIKADNIDRVVRAGGKLSSRAPAFLGRPTTLRRFIGCAKLSLTIGACCFLVSVC